MDAVRQAAVDAWCAGETLGSAALQARIGVTSSPSAIDPRSRQAPTAFVTKTSGTLALAMTSASAAAPMSEAPEASSPVGTGSVVLPASPVAHHGLGLPGPVDAIAGLIPLASLVAALRAANAVP